MKEKGEETTLTLWCIYNFLKSKQQSKCEIGRPLTDVQQNKRKMLGRYTLQTSAFLVFAFLFQRNLIQNSLLLTIFC